MHTSFLAAAALSLVVAGAALAQTPAAPAFAPKILRGDIVSLAADKITLKTREGKRVEVALTKSWSVSLTKAVTAAEILPGSFIGTTNMPESEGVGRSLEVHVFPPGVKMGEGHYGWDLKPGSMMTNGTVGKVVSGAKGRELDVSYSSGVRHIVVPPGTPIVQITPADRALAQPGTKVFVVAGSTASGGLITNSVVVGENGAAPPM
jgi:hypothetical protein